MIGILCRCREDAIAIMCDIENMGLSILSQSGTS